MPSDLSLALWSFDSSKMLHGDIILWLRTIVCVREHESPTRSKVSPDSSTLNACYSSMTACYNRGIPPWTLVPSKLVLKALPIGGTSKIMFLSNCWDGVVSEISKWDTSLCCKMCPSSTTSSGISSSMSDFTGVEMILTLLNLEATFLFSAAPKVEEEMAFLI